MTEKECFGDRCNAADADEWKTIARNTIDKWTQLDTLATEVVRAAMHGDQQLIRCLVFLADCIQSFDCHAGDHSDACPASK